MKTVYGGFIRGVCRTASSLSALSENKAQVQPRSPPSNRPLSDELVGLIKKELRTQLVTEVARLHGLKPNVVRNIKDGLNYKEVKETP